MFGLVSSNTGSSYALAQLISTAMSAKFNYIPTKEEKIGIVAAVLLSWLIMNTIGRSFLRHLLYISVSLNSVGLIALAVSVLVKAPTHQPASFVFTGFVDNSGPTPDHGWSTLISPAYVVFIGSYMGLTSFFGYEASAHLAEETIRAAWTAPFGIITSVGFSAFFGLLLITALLFSIQDLSIFTSPRYDNPVLEILIDIFGKNGGLLLFALPIWGCWFCGLYSTMSNSRLIWAFSRDRGIVRVPKQYKDEMLTVL
jgi:amino acid transporter